MADPNAVNMPLTSGVNDAGSKYLRIDQHPETGEWWGIRQDGSFERVKSPTKTTERPTEFERLGKGADDVVSGIKQAYLYHTDPEEYGRFTAKRDENLEYYNRALDEWTDGGMDFWGMGGEAGMLAPVGAMNFGRTMGGKMVSSAVQGGAAGSVLYTPEGQSRALNTGVGAVGGLAVPPIMSGVKSGVARGVKGGMNALNKLRSAIIPDSQLTVRIQNRFPDIAGVSPATQEKIRAEARRQLEMTGDFDPAALERIARAEELGFTGDAAMTTGQASRDSSLFSREQNLAKLEDGAEINARFTAQNRRLTEELREDLPRSSISSAEAGDAVVKSVNDQWDATQRGVSKVYKMIRNRYGDATIDDGLPSFQQYLDVTGDDATLAPLVDSVMRRGKRIGLFGDEPQPVTIENIENLRKFIGNISDKNEPALKRAKRQMIDNLDDAVTDTFGDDVFKSARDTARRRFEMFNTKLMDKIVGGDTSGDVLYKRVMSANTKDVEQMKYVLKSAGEEGEEAWQALRSKTIDEIWSKAAPVGADGEFRPASYRNAIKGIGEKKMKVLFTPDEYERLMNIQKASTDMMVEPPFSSVNRSNTTPTLMNLMRRVPTIGGELAGRVDDAAQAAGRQFEVDRSVSGMGKPQLSLDEVIKNMEALQQGKIGQAMVPLRNAAPAAPAMMFNQWQQDQ